MPRQQLADAAAAKMARSKVSQMANFAMPDLDLVFVMDVTGSMDDEIRGHSVEPFAA